MTRIAPFSPNEASKKPDILLQFFLPPRSVESNNGGRIRVVAQLRLRGAKPRERQESTPSIYEATEGADSVRQPQPLTAAVSMTTRPGPAPADAGGEDYR